MVLQVGSDKIKDTGAYGVYFCPGKTNCLTYTPKNINLTLSNGTLTLKAGSKVYVPNGKNSDGSLRFDEVVIGSDLSTTRKANIQEMYFVSENGTVFNQWLYVYSGTSAPTGYSGNYAIWYDITNNLVKRTTDGGSTWVSGFSLPVCLATSNTASIISINQIFDWCGYIGSTAFVLPNVEGLIPNGFNADGTYKSIKFKTSGVLISNKESNWTQTQIQLMDANISHGLADYDYVYDKSNNVIMMKETGNIFKNVAWGSAVLSSGRINSLTPYGVKSTNDLQAIKEIYNGSQKVYQYLPAGTVFFESATPGTYTFTAPRSCTVSIIMVGAGGGAAYAHGGYWESTANGGSAGMITGTMNITKGTSYSIVVGAGGGGIAYEGNNRVYAGAGGATTFAGQTAGGGGGANAQNTGGANVGTAGTATVTISTLNASNGVAGSTASRYGSYGGGGASRSGAGQGGYIRIAVA